MSSEYSTYFFHRCYCVQQGTCRGHRSKLEGVRGLNAKLEGVRGSIEIDLRVATHARTLEVRAAFIFRGINRNVPHITG